eukprot:CAMPEP_0194360656 /NCGR_PEP_ID=MMETSP0174-20130528/8022_1 /TAXON_ID=216777 /ORGANISM="Proboscia alata, Strain PI-D3" /LENGTH=42 /DNA_ID= /DNA_START= /DNA_END= /DNA_ORIENTATION=
MATNITARPKSPWTYTTIPKHVINATNNRGVVTNSRARMRQL